MTDERFVFIEDVRDRKNVAHSACHKKNGSTSKKCTLPSDNMTAKERKEMCGEVSSIKLNEPVTWAEMEERSLPQTLRRDYIKNLVSKYAASAEDLKGVLKVDDLESIIGPLGLECPPVHTEKTQSQKLLFRQFKGHMAPEEVAEEGLEIVKAHTYDQLKKDSKKLENYVQFLVRVMNLNKKLVAYVLQCAESTIGVQLKQRLHLDIDFTTTHQIYHGLPKDAFDWLQGEVAKWVHGQIKGEDFVLFAKPASECRALILEGAGIEKVSKAEKKPEFLRKTLQIANPSIEEEAISTITPDPIEHLEQELPKVTNFSCSFSHCTIGQLRAFLNSLALDPDTEFDVSVDIREPQPVKKPFTYINYNKA